MADLPITSDEGATPIVINDPTTTANVANVKAGSTAAAAADNSLVVAVSPNSPLPAGTNTIGAVTGTKTNNGAAPSTNNVGVIPGVASSMAPSYSGGNMVLLSLDLSGNTRVITASGSTTAGNLTNNNAAPAATNLGVLPALANAASPSWTEGDQVLESVDLTGRQRVRGTLTTNNAAPVADGLMTLTHIANAVAPSYTEGNVVLASCDLAGNTRIIGVKTNNNAAPSTQVGVIPAVANALHPTWVEGNQVLLSADLLGNLRVSQSPATTPTYCAMIQAVVPAATPTDIFTLTGSATKTIVITKVFMQGVQTAAGSHDMIFLLRSAANTGGTSTTITGVPLDSNDAGATATCRAYTANPSGLGTLIGNFWVLTLLLRASGTATINVSYQQQFSDLGDQGITLRGTSQVFAINGGSASFGAGAQINFCIEWLEI